MYSVLLNHLKPTLCSKTMDICKCTELIPVRFVTTVNVPYNTIIIIVSLKGSSIPGLVKLQTKFNRLVIIIGGHETRIPH